MRIPTLKKDNKVLIAFDEKIVEKDIHLKIMHLFIHWRQLKISHFFIAQAYFKVSKDIKLISTLYYILKIQIRGNFSKWHIIIQDFEKICSP